MRQRICKEAPNLQGSVRNATSQFPKSELERGDFHPALQGGKTDLEVYLKQRHALLSINGDFQDYSEPGQGNEKFRTG